MTLEELIDRLYKADAAIHPAEEFVFRISCPTPGVREELEPHMQEHAESLKTFVALVLNGIVLSEERAGKLRALPYKEYLQSEHWEERREIALIKADWKCSLCNKSESLNVHHRTYERLGKEMQSDLTVLCRHCHAKFHDKLPKQPEY